MRKQPRQRKAHTHIMGLPWVGNGHSFSCCTVAGCDFTQDNGATVIGAPGTLPDVEQGRLFDVWGAGYVPAPGDKWQPR